MYVLWTNYASQRMINILWENSFIQPSPFFYKDIPHYWVYTKALHTTGCKAFHIKGFSQRCSGITWSYLASLVGCLSLTARLSSGCLARWVALVWFGLVWVTHLALRRSHNVCWYFLGVCNRFWFRLTFKLINQVFLKRPV